MEPPGRGKGQDTEERHGLPGCGRGHGAGGYPSLSWLFPVVPVTYRIGNLAKHSSRWLSIFLPTRPGKLWGAAAATWCGGLKSSFSPQEGTCAVSFESTRNQQKGAEELLTVAGCDTLTFPKHAVRNSGWQGWMVMVIFCSRDVVSISYYPMTKQPQISYCPAWNDGRCYHYQVVIFGQVYFPRVVVTTRNQWGCCCFEFLTLQ